jgi:hypothetical protein
MKILKHESTIQRCKKGIKILRRIISIILLIIVYIAWAHAQELTIRITAPADGAEVPHRPFVEGTVTDSKVEVRVIVHPMETSDYWVQPLVTVRENGKWKVMIYIGRPGMIDVDKHFEIIAVANPKFGLEEGKVLNNWPEARAKSQVIEVIRK